MSWLPTNVSNQRSLSLSLARSLASRNSLAVPSSSATHTHTTSLRWAVRGLAAVGGLRCIPAFHISLSLPPTNYEPSSTKSDLAQDITERSAVPHANLPARSCSRPSVRPSFHPAQPPASAAARCSSRARLTHTHTERPRLARAYDATGVGQ